MYSPYAYSTHNCDLPYPGGAETSPSLCPRISRSSSTQSTGRGTIPGRMVRRRSLVFNKVNMRMSNYGHALFQCNYSQLAFADFVTIGAVSTAEIEHQSRHPQYPIEFWIETLPTNV